MRDLESLQEACRNWIEEALVSGKQEREHKWSESIAVGNKSFIEATMKRLGIKALGRKVYGNNEGFEIREQAGAYRASFASESGTLSPKNTYFWKDRHLLRGSL